MKRILCGVLAVLLCLCLGACGCRHEWKEADCDHPRVCALCGESEGEALGHETGDWEQTSLDLATAEWILEKKCARCGQVTDTQREALESLLDGNTFLLSPLDFQLRMDSVLAHYIAEGITVDTKLEVLQDTVVYNISFEGEYLADLGLRNDLSQDPEEKMNAFDTVTALIYDPEAAQPLCAALMQTLDPMLSEEEAGELCASLLAQEGEILEHNGIFYNFAQTPELTVINAGTRRIQAVP